jgi:hypothetical protein
MICGRDIKKIKKKFILKKMADELNKKLHLIYNEPAYKAAQEVLHAAHKEAAVIQGEIIALEKKKKIEARKAQRLHFNQVNNLPDDFFFFISFTAFDTPYVTFYWEGIGLITYNVFEKQLFVNGGHTTEETLPGMVQIIIEVVKKNNQLLCDVFLN